MLTFLSIVFILIAALMIVVILLQRGRGGGLSGAFGAGGGGNTAFGTKTGDVFTTVTVILFAVFLLMAVFLNWRFRSESPTLLRDKAAATMSATTTPAALDELLKQVKQAAATRASATTSMPAASRPATSMPPATVPASQPKK